jgi:hypothetical protein
MKFATKILTVLGIAALSVTVGAASAHDNNNRHRQEVWHAFLFGQNETPSISTPASGHFTAVIDEDNSVINFRFSYRDLVGGDILFAHIHFGERRVMGGVMVFLCGGGGKPACPPAPATIEGSITPADVVGPMGQGINPATATGVDPQAEFAKVLDAIRGGASYANIHTKQFMAGEMRGQLFR